LLGPARGVDRRLIDQLETDAILLTDAVAARLPAGFVKKFVGFGNVELVLGVLRNEGRGVVEVPKIEGGTTCGRQNTDGWQFARGGIPVI
jgi:hypothetical protein